MRSLIIICVVVLGISSTSIWAKTKEEAARFSTTKGPIAEKALPQPPATAIPEYRPIETTGMVRISDKGFFLSPAKWPSLTIPVCWEAGTPEGPERKWVEDAVITSWQAHSRLRFIGFETCATNASGLRVVVRDDGPDDGPHTVQLGKFLDGVKDGMVLNFTFKTWSQSCASSPAQRKLCIGSIAVHEFGHALGFAHEQNRNDTPGECTKKPQGTSGDLVLTPWDLDSVMNYCNPIYNNDGKLSAGDEISVVKVYGK